MSGCSSSGPQSPRSDHSNNIARSDHSNHIDENNSSNNINGNNNKKSIFKDISLTNDDTSGVVNP